MNVSTTREPFTKPLTGSEMRHIKQRIHEIRFSQLRKRGQAFPSDGPGPLETHEQMVKEVHGAIAHFRKKRPRAAAALNALTS